MAELIIQSGKLQGQRLYLPPKEMVVGRDEDCDMKIASSLVSRKHCILKSTPDGILVTDLASQNGTHVNDVAITEPTLLKEGDYLRIGAILLAVPLPSKLKPPFGSPQPKISEAEIADWLTEESTNYSSSDTTTIPAYTGPPSNPTPPPPPKVPKPQVAQAPQIAKVLSVKDEAAAVIRKHWETVKAKNKR